METTISVLQVVLAMGVGIIGLIIMILRTKIHPFLALILTSIIIGLLIGMKVESIIPTITKGFGGILGAIGIIIGFGVIMGEIFEMSGAGKRMAKTFIRIFGKGREELAMAVTGFFVSIPIFCDSAFIVLSPIVKSISKLTRKSVISLGVALALGLGVTHTMVPPTPGPLAVSGIFGADLGAFILWSLLIALPMTLIPFIYIKLYLEKKLYQIVDEDGNFQRMEYQDPIYIAVQEADTELLPSNIASFGPILIPIFLILIGSIAKLAGVSGVLGSIIGFVSAPVVAVAIGVLWAIVFLTKGHSKADVVSRMDNGLSKAAVIIFVTGGGGALGMILRDSGAGKIIADTMLSLALPGILLPVAIATLVRFLQGSGTVSMITAATVSAPIVLELGVNPIFAGLSACVGAIFFSHFNDSYFWVVNRTLGVKETKEQVQVWSITSTLSWATGLVCVLILNAFFG